MPQYVIETAGPLWWTGETWTPHRAAAKRFEFMSTAVVHGIEHIRDGRTWHTAPAAAEDTGESVRPCLRRRPGPGRPRTTAACPFSHPAL